MSSYRIPVPLRNLLEPRRIIEISFRPLLMTGCLGVTRRGFTIFVRAQPDRAEALVARLKSEGPAHSCLPVNMRFTIAHEIAHTFFFDLKKAKPASKVRLDSADRANDLEIACNNLAARILFPTEMLQREVGALTDANVDFNPAALRGLARAAAVSTKLVVLRIAKSFDWGAREKAVVCLEKNENQWHVTATAAHSALRPIVKQSLVWDRLSNLANSEKFVSSGGDKTQTECFLPCSIAGRAAVQECLVAFEPSTKRQKAAFMTISRYGSPRLVRGNDIRGSV